MFRYGKTARQGVAALSYLAECWQAGRARVSSAEVALARHMPIPLAAKLLSMASAEGLLTGSTGPGGGYSLSRPPSQITLAEIVYIFERVEKIPPCPFGPGWCGSGNPCPLHDKFLELNAQINGFLEQTTLQVFAENKDRRPLPEVE